MQNKDIEQELTAILKQSISAPFLFIGSGFSRRYIDLPDWKGLLEYFCQSTNKPLEEYLSISEDDFPRATTLLANDFSQIWWKENRSREDIFNSEDWKNSKITPLKYEVSQYIKNFNEKKINRR